MATDTYLLMGEVIEDPEGQEKEVEKILHGLLHALVAEEVLKRSTELKSECFGLEEK